MVTAIQTPLFVPANRPERFAKAAASGANAVILDLEDAVAAADKDAARAQLDAGFAPLPVLVRINAHGTPWHDADLAAVIRAGFAAVILPKAEQPSQVAATAATLNDTPLIALIESAQGLANARAIAALDGVARLAFGSVDFCADLGCAHQQEVLLPARSELVLASRLAGIAPPIDGVTVQLDDPAIAEGDAAHARALGMTGKLCIHPRQIDPIRRAFAPSAAELVWARRVLAAGEGAVSVDGQMVDAPVRIRAHAILNAAANG
ncbi:CoA ester lyase [Thalassovita sp.]|uniref:HpcH/HpaI aldolase/citrate lyase family protein n=1 Tax=Thalassovita sp. TaxID=1979401 RepID=UPI0029DE8155|nr:CoA ester lyase [Thalassovita sp.]